MGFTSLTSWTGDLSFVDSLAGGLVYGLTYYALAEIIRRQEMFVFKNIQIQYKKLINQNS